MKKLYSLVALTVFCMCAGVSQAQIVGTDCFLQGQFLEVGVNQMAGFGTCSSPASYHAHACCGTTTPFTPSSAMDASYDWGHDGWSTGSPELMGPYTQPGYPQEGWSLQVGATEYQNGGWGGTCSGAFDIPGTHISYVNAGGNKIDNWKGNVAGLDVYQQTRVDTFSSWAVVTTLLVNTTGAPIAGVWYERTCDPDNTSYWSGTSMTSCVIVHQNEDARHMVMVGSHGLTAASGSTPEYNYANSYLGYVAKDCRARCGVINGLSPTGTPSQLWTNTPTVTSPVFSGVLGDSVYEDKGIYIVFNVGTIPAFDTAVVAYAYVYNGHTGIDSALPDPQIVLNGVPRPIVPVPNPNYDTFNVCLYPGMTSLPVNLLNANDKGWTLSHWTWSPATGLATTTGVTNTINTVILPSVFTYTITGLDSSVGGLTCRNKTFYLTIRTCNGPCEGDTLWLNEAGDSTGATYAWSGPAPSTTVFSTSQKTFKYPATMADGGLYTVVKTVGGLSYSNTYSITIQPKPVVTASSNAPLCIGAANTLSLTATSSITGGTAYEWTANTTPPFFSTVQNPVINPFAEQDTGWYQVIARTPAGCKDTDRTHVTLADIPAPPIVTAYSPYCQSDVFIPFTVSGLVPGGAPLWYTVPTGGTGSYTSPVINTAFVGITTIWFSQIIGSCEGLRDSVKVTVNPLPAPIAGTAEVCQYFTTTLSDPTPGGVWSSSDPAIATIDAGGTVYGVSGGIATMTYTLPTTGCYRTVTFTVHPKPAPPAIPLTKYCQYKAAVPLNPTGTNLVYYGLGVTPGSSFAPIPTTDVVGVFTYYVTQTSSFGCVSDSAAYPVTILPEPAAPITADTSYCQGFAAPALTATGSSLLWYTSPTATTGSSTAPVPSTVNAGILTYYVTQTVNGCESHMAPLRVTTLYVPKFNISGRTWVCQFDSINFAYDGPTLVDGGFLWTLPYGSSFINHTDEHGQDVSVKFDTAWGIHRVLLTASDYNGRCFSTDTLQIRVVPAPDASNYIKSDVCLGDTIELALSHVSSGAAVFNWFVDDVPLSSSTAVNMLSHTSNSGGPFVITWNNKGRHIVRVNGASQEGCVALPANDTVDVHALPDATYKVVKTSAKLCVEDSVQFEANIKDYAYTYKWEPEHFFENNNQPTIWGKVEQVHSTVKLTVTDPFGCANSSTQLFNPDVCCTVWFPNAFTPGAQTNNTFHPVFAGFHRFHIFRVSNRWGQTIFESSDSNPEWNGTYNGVPQDVGTYYYYIKYDCGGKVLEQKGDITLVR